MISNRSCVPVASVGVRTIWKSNPILSKEKSFRERRKGVSPLGQQAAHFRLCSARANPSKELAQDNGNIPLYDPEKTKILVETAMLAAVSGMASLLLTILKLESYLYYLMPFPLVLASLRSGFKAAQKTLVATFFLMFVLLGPARALTYILLFGFTGMTLGALWTIPSPWWVTFPACTGAYVTGMLGYVCTGSILLRENLFRLVAYNIQSLAVRWILKFVALFFPCMISFPSFTRIRKHQRAPDLLASCFLRFVFMFLGWMKPDLLMESVENVKCLGAVVVSCLSET